MTRTFAIGDIHGCSETFKKLISEKLNIQKSDEIYCVGDYIDRGKDSKAVIDFIIDLRLKGCHIHTLRGNHEQMMMDSVMDREKLYLWLINGGGETLESFGISSVNEISPGYLSFLRDTKFFIENDEYIFVHAGLNFRIEDPFTDTESMLWIRDDYFDGSKIGNRKVIHGHTPIPAERLIRQSNSYNINIDGGCVYHDRTGYGNLFALSIPNMQFISVKNID